MSYFTNPFIVTQITNYCNARCEHCFNAYHVENVGSTVHLDVDAYFDFLDRFSREMCAGKRPFICLSGGGEPTLHPRFLDLVVGLANRRYCYSIVTNGLHWKRWLQPLSDSVALSYLDRVHFSLYGDKETHDKVTQVKSFNSMMQAIRYCRKRNIKRQLHVALDKTNINSIPEVIRIVAEEDVSCGAVFYPAFETDYMRKNKLTLDKKDFELLRRYKNNTGGRLSFTGVDSFQTQTGYMYCDELDSDKISVNYNGDLCFCCSLIGLSFNQNETEIFGTIKDANLTETFVRREEIKAQWRKAYVRAVGQQKIKKFASTKCNWCIHEFFDK